MEVIEDRLNYKDIILGNLDQPLSNNRGSTVVSSF